jgi:hypothetical protein
MLADGRLEGKVMQKGFALIEWMIQFVLCTCLCMLVFMLFRTWLGRLSALHGSFNNTLQLPLALDVLRRDVQAADNNTFEVRADRCVCRTQGQRIVWRFKEGVLYRIQKKYDEKAKQWRKAVRNVAAEGVTGYYMVPIRINADKTRLDGITVMSPHKKSTYVIALRNGKST